MADIETMMKAAIERRVKNGWAHKHHRNCIHNLPPKEQIEMRGKTVDWWMKVIGTMPVQITPDEWEDEPLFPVTPTENGGKP